MTAEEQKRYIKYLSERLNAADLENRAMKLVLQDFLDKQNGNPNEQLTKCHKNNLPLHPMTSLRFRLPLTIGLRYRLRFTKIVHDDY